MMSRLNFFIQYLKSVYPTRVPVGNPRQQLIRLVARYRQNGRLQRTVAGFKTRYTAKDVRLSAAMDSLHDTPCGSKVKKLCERACTLFGQIEYSALASISVSHLYNKRVSTPYVYHINAVDEVTQFETVCSVEKISERYLVPALEQLLQDYPP